VRVALLAVLAMISLAAAGEGMRYVYHPPESSLDVTLRKTGVVNR
jgi:hypothetical protein